MSKFDFRRLQVGDWVLGIAAALLLFFFLSNIPSTFIAWVTTPSPEIPQSVGARRWTYALALWALMSISSLATAVLIDNLRTLHSRPQREWRHPLNVSLWIETLLMITIIMGFAPDMVILLVYGEQSRAGLEHLRTIDQAMNALCSIPFLTAFLMRTRGLPVIMFQLTKEPIPTDLWPTWAMVRERLFMLALVLVISMGVAVGK